MDPVFKIPPTPGLPLFPVSPERANRQYLPQSPSLPSDLATFHKDPFAPGHSRTSSDVQGKVAQFNNLSKEAIQRRKDNEAALRRAVVGREEAEGETKRLKEENRILRKELEEGRSRERRVGERVEAVMEEMQRLKEMQTHSKALYEKEVRRARKEAFKSSSALVSLQEELKTTRNRFTLMREEVEVQKRKVDDNEKGTFAAQYQLVGLQEELDRLTHQLRLAQEEKDGLKTSLKEQEVARIAAEGMIPIPTSPEVEDFPSPKKSKPHSRMNSEKENVDPVVVENSGASLLIMVKEELELERQMRAKAHDMIDFMKMECQFRCCSCRLAESQGTMYIHDDRFTLQVAEKAAQIAEWIQQPQDKVPINVLPTEPEASIAQETQEEPEDPEPLIEFSPTTGTFRTIPSPARRQADSPSKPLNLDSNGTPAPASQPGVVPLLEPIPLLGSPSLLSLSSEMNTVKESPEPPTLKVAQATSPPPESVPSTPYALPLPPVRPTTTRIVSTTTTIPLASDDPFSPAPHIPSTPLPSSTMTRMIPLALASPSPTTAAETFSPFPTISREAALEQIRQRRGRARSIAAGQATPRKAMVEGLIGRRDCSAPSGRAGRGRL